MGTTARCGSARRFVVALAAVAILAAMGSPSSADEPEGAADQPDVLVSKSDASFIGDGVYNTTAAGQTLTRTKPRGSSSSFYLRVQNDRPNPEETAGSVSGTSPSTTTSRIPRTSPASR